MKNTQIIIGLLLVLLVNALSAQQNPWAQLYLNTSINQDNYSNTYSYIEVAPNNTLYLLECSAVNGSFGGDWRLAVKLYTGSSWQQVGQTLNRNTQNNEEHCDFLIAPNGDLYIGMKDSILKYNPTNSLWESTYVPEYYGGLSANDSSKIHFIYRVDGTSGAAYSNLNIARFENGSTTLLNTLATDLLMVPRKVNTSNKIIFQGNDIYISMVRQSSDNIYVFKGSFANGFQKLEASSTGSTLFAGLGLSSMAVDNTGKILISRKSPTGNTLLITQYNESNDSWTAFDTVGINATSCNANKIMYDNNGVLHLIYNGSNNTGFIFKYVNNQWQHIGPTSFFSYQTISSINKPWLAFDSNNTLYFSSGLGSTSNPLQVFKYDATSSIDLSENKSTEISIYPNPAKNYTTLNHLPINSSLKIYDIAGKQVYSMDKINEPRILINTEIFNSGMYFLFIQTNGIYESHNIIIHK